LNERRKMFPTDLPKIHTDELNRCEEKGQITGVGKNLSPTQKNDTAIKEAVYQALWKDNVLRAIEYYEIDVHVNNKIVYLYGHIVSTGSQLRIMNAIKDIPGIMEIISHLVLDDQLTLDVATSLGKLEQTNGCKFFTGASHGVVSINGTVHDQNMKSLAGTCVASNPHVRGVINYVRVLGGESETQAQPFLQPAIGEAIYFRDGLSGAVIQVIMNPNTRCVIAMSVKGDFSEPRNILRPLAGGKARPLEQVVVVPMHMVRYLTKVSGFLHINSNERDRFTEFNSTRFFTPESDWTPPYPYCPGEVLFPVEYQTADFKFAYGSNQFTFEAMPDSKPSKKQFFTETA
jgi:osmotically-inducible protein OsmY